MFAKEVSKNKRTVSLAAMLVVATALILAVMLSGMALGSTPHAAYAAEVENTTDFAGGLGTEASPYLVSTPEQLKNIGKAGYQGTLDNIKHFKLENDIDLSDYLSENPKGTYADGGGWNEGTGWLGIGYELAGVPGQCERIVFDGAGYTVSGLWQDKSASLISSSGKFGNNAGLFTGLMASTIKNLSVITSEKGIVGIDNAGILVSYANNNVSISNCYFEGEVSTKTTQNPTGIGLVAGRGLNTLHLSNIFAKGKVVAFDTVATGGLIGEISGGSIKNCGVVAEIFTGGQIAGGLIGLADVYNELIIENVYTVISEVDGKDYGSLDYLYGIVGKVDYRERNKVLTTTNVYFVDNDAIVKADATEKAMAFPLKAINGQSEINVPQTVKATEIDSTDIFKATSYSGFDFTSASPVWTILEGASYPFISGFTIYEVKLSSGEYVYSGVAPATTDLEIEESGWLKGIVPSFATVLDVSFINPATTAGTYAVSAAVKTGFAGKGIVIDAEEGLAVKITKKALKITVNPLTVTYGQTVALSVSYEGFATGESASVLGGELVYAGTGTNVGIYEVKASGLTSNNYDITFQKGTLTINKAAANGKPDAAVEKVDANSVIMKNIAGAEYSVDGGQTWTSANGIGNLKQNKKYTVLARFAETENYLAGETVEVEFKTKLSGGSVAGIVIGTLAGAALLGFAVYQFLIKGKKKPAKASAGSGSSEASSTGDVSSSDVSANDENGGNPWVL